MNQNPKKAKFTGPKKVSLDDLPYPVRINRYLYLTNVCSRRKADQYITAGKIKINGKKAVLGDKVEKGDKVIVDKVVSARKDNHIYLLLNKPAGIVSHNPEKGQESAGDLLKEINPAWATLAVLGRLDRESHGLLLLSDDGRIVDKLLNPRYDHEKEYLVEVDKRITGPFTKQMAEGVKIEGYKTKPAKVTKQSPRSFTIVLTEGKKHQIRRMCAALGYQVQDLKRVRIGNLLLGNLGRGQARTLTAVEEKDLLSSLGI